MVVSRRWRKVHVKEGLFSKMVDKKRDNVKDKGAFLKTKGVRGKDAQEQELIEKVIDINRTSKVVKGGRKIAFSVLVAVGDGNGKVGYGLGKAREVPEAIRKGIDQAKRENFIVPMKETTIPHQIIGKQGATRVLLKPAGRGTGIIAGSPVRAVCEAAGIKDILTKCLKSDNAVNVVKATTNGLRRLRLRSLREEDETE